MIFGYDENTAQPFRQCSTVMRYSVIEWVSLFDASIRFSENNLLQKIKKSLFEARGKM